MRGFVIVVEFQDRGRLFPNRLYTEANWVVIDWGVMFEGECSRAFGVNDVGVAQHKLNCLFCLALRFCRKTKKHKRVIPYPCLMCVLQVLPHSILRVVLQHMSLDS